MVSRAPQQRHQDNRRSNRDDDDRRHGGGYNGSEKHGEHTGGGWGSTSWDKNRVWKVVNLDAAGGHKLAMVQRPEPFAPGGGKIPQDDLLVRWLKDGDVVEQVGHSKKMRGYMVMPVKVVGGNPDTQGTAQTLEGSVADGWVTRRF